MIYWEMIIPHSPAPLIAENATNFIVYRTCLPTARLLNAVEKIESPPVWMHFEKHWEMEEDIFLTNRK
jgi:hypothetical protein